jgi:hypothetical protein
MIIKYAFKERAFFMKRLFAVAVLALWVTGTQAEVNFSGDIQYRFRYEWNVLHAIPDSTRGDYTNRYMWNLKGSYTKDNLLLGIRLSNPLGAATENIADNLSYVTQGNYNLVSIPELYFKWTVAKFALSAGIIPVEENTVLDLVMYENVKYAAYKNNASPGDNARAGCDPWPVLMNNSQKGVACNYGIRQTENFSLKVGVLSSVGKDTTSFIYKPGEKFNNDQVRFMLTLPMAYKGSFITATPIFHVRTSIFQSSNGMYSNHSYAGGLDFGIKPINLIAAKLGFAYGTYKNDVQKNDAGYKATNPFGLLSYAGFIVNPGYGEFDADFDYSLAQDKLNTLGTGGVFLDRHDQLFFMDLKYGMPIKSLIFMPRLRLWQRFNDVTGNQLMTIRPEFIVKAVF